MAQFFLYQECNVAQFFPYHECNITRHNFSPTRSVTSSDRLVQNCVTLSQWFLRKAAAFSTEQCTIPLLLHNFEVSGGALNWSLQSYGFICNYFLYFYACAQMTEQQNVITLTQESEQEPGQRFFSQSCIHQLRKPVRTDLLL